MVIMLIKSAITKEREVDCVWLLDWTSRHTNKTTGSVRKSIVESVQLFLLGSQMFTDDMWEKRARPRLRADSR